MCCCGKPTIAYTPWGAPDTVEPIGTDGIAFVSTPSHGGFYVPPALNSRVPAEHRAITFNRQGESGWYEEDCDAALVVLAFPSLFGPHAVALARVAFDHWFAPQIARANPEYGVDTERQLAGMED